MAKKISVKCHVFECDKFLLLLMSNQIVNPDLQQVRKLQNCKMRLTLNINLMYQNQHILSISHSNILDQNISA